MYPQRCLAIVNQADAGPGVFAEAARDDGWEFEEWTPSEGGSPLRELGSYDAVITFGGAMNANQEDAYPWLGTQKAQLRSLLDDGVPVLGVCLGSQLLAEAAGAPVERSPEPEIGWFDVEVTPDGAEDPVIGPLAPQFEAFQWHSYRSPLPPGAVELAKSPISLQAYRVGESAWGIQFHAEVTAEISLGWAERYTEDPDAIRIGIDPAALSATIRERIEPWNDLGRALCSRFLATAKRR